MKDKLRILACQTNPTVGDIAGNTKLALDCLADARREGAALAVLPELALVGYPPEDLLMRPAFLDAAERALEELAAATAGGPGLLIGAPVRGSGGALFNSAVYLADGKIAARHDKVELPNYGVFDEARYFTPGCELATLIEVGGVKLGIAICEDLWLPRVPEALADSGAEALLALNASPYRRSVEEERAAAFDRWSANRALPYLFVNPCGGQDELVFDGGTAIVNDRYADREELIPVFEPGNAVAVFDPSTRCFESESPPVPRPDVLHQTYLASVTGLRDYIRKNGFSQAMLGLSGGIDSALTAAIAADALGPENVWCIMLPSRFTSAESLEDARLCAEWLGTALDTLPISPGVDALTGMLEPHANGPGRDIAAENLQSRLRGTVLMALSNTQGRMLLTTGNKSELAVGYATLYGDMNGAWNALKDLYKTDVFELARWRNANHPPNGLAPGGAVIPERIIDKPPSAELREDQKDSDSLPPYEVLDAILRALVEEERSVDAIIADGFKADVVRRVERLLRRSEFKRFQAAPGAKLTARSFGRDWRFPLTNGFSG